MLDHNKVYVEKMHSIDTELAGHLHKLDVKLQGFIVLLHHAISPLSELHNNNLL